VQLFFVLSGYLITGILLRALGSATFFRTVYLRRRLRIFPLYFAFLAVAFWIVPLVIGDPEWTAVARRNQWWYWTYTANWVIPFGHGVPGLSHFWSLSVEEQFYLLWPLIVFALPRRALIGAGTAVLLLTPLVRYGLHAGGLPAQAQYEFTVARWDALAAGALLAVLLQGEGGRQWLRRWIPRLAIVSLAALLAFVGLAHGFHSDDLRVSVAGQSVVAILSAVLIYYSTAVMPGTAALRGAMAAPWLRFLGRYSYAIYVFHFPIHLVAARYLAQTVNGADTGWRVVRLGLYTGGIAALSIVAALISWRLLEKPFLDLKDRLAPRLS
jgi:peptidoglycan/LPS O-acetylase OafA/YrhL